MTEGGLHGMAQMSSRPIHALRLRILAGCALAVLGGAAAQAQTQASPGANCKPVDLSFGGPKSQTGDILISSDLAKGQQDSYLDLQGNVRIRYDDSTLTAGQVHYDIKTGRVSGNQGVQILNDDGTAEFAKTFDFDQNQHGTATGFSALLPDNAKLAAASIVRPSDTRTELNRAIFTPCETCRADGSPKEPTFSISANHVVRDEEACRVVYEDAVLRFKGVPVFYAPYFSHPDPSVKEQSGLLAPRFQQTQRRGLSWEQPYLFTLSPYSDLVVSPQINTKVNPFLNLEHRRRFWSGEVSGRYGYTNDQDFNSEGRTFGPDRTKAYVLAEGFFEPNALWSWGFTAQAAHDRRVFDQYSISDLYNAQGLFLNDDRRLISQVYAVRQNQRSYLSVSAMGFQSLRSIASAPPDAFGIRPLEDDHTLPVVAPLVEYRIEPGDGIFGGRLRLKATTAVVERTRSPLLAGQPGIDSRRVSLGGDWRKPYTLGNGIRVEPFAALRADLYNIADNVAVSAGSYSVTRGIATAGVDVTWPFIRRGPTGTTTIIEPIIQIAASPDTKIDPRIPNEDSTAFEFDDTNLFSYNKFPGHDLYEGGQRVNVGVRSSIDWGGGRVLRLLAGRSFRDEADPVFAPRTGLNQPSSDWIVSVDYNPVPGLSLYGRARLDDKGLDPRRVEAGANVSVGRARGYARYLSEDQDFTGVRREDVEAAGEVFITKTWGITANAVRDLQTDEWRRRGMGVIYMDDCLRFDVVYQREDNPVLGTRPSQAFMVRLTLATLGDEGYRNNNNRTGPQRVRR